MIRNVACLHSRIASRLRFLYTRFADDAGAFLGGCIECIFIIVEDFFHFICVQNEKFIVLC